MRQKCWVAVALAAAFMPGYSGAQSNSALPRNTVVVPAPTWTAQPTDAEIAAAFPKKAARRGVGLVSLICAKDAAGGLEGCKVEQENPAGQGFGDAALGLATRFHLATAGSAGGPITVPVRIALKPATAPDKSSLERYYPPKALAQEKSGDARLRCWVVTSGDLSDCRVLAEAPKDYGFGEAALPLAGFVNMIKGRDGATAGPGSIVDLSIKFKLDLGPPATSSP